MTQLNQDCLQVLRNNRRTVNGLQYTIPSPDTYPYQWLWDSCFHAIILTHFNIPDAKKEILALLSKQFENGMVPHIIYWRKKDAIDIKWGKRGVSSLTQPPMIAYAIWRIFQKDHDKSFLEKVYPNLYHFYRYLLTERDPHGRHLVGIINPDESGEDNSSRFDIPLNLHPKQTLAESFKRRLQLVGNNIRCKFDAPFCMRKYFWVKDVPFNSIMVENLGLLSKIAQFLGYSEDAKFFSLEKINITKAMRKYMLEDGIFWSTFGEGYKKIHVKTWAIFAPLFAKIPTKKEADTLIERYLLNPKEFWTNFPVPTVSVSDPSFNCKGFWRGSTWIATNWFIYKGLKNYGFNDIAVKIRESAINLIQKSGFREYFNPVTGEGFGAKNFTWGGLVIDMD